MATWTRSGTSQRDDADDTSGLKPMAGASGTVLLPPEQTHGIWLEFRERR